VWERGLCDEAYYRILGADRGATQAELLAAYEQHVANLFTAKVPSTDRGAEEADRRSKKLMKAYDVLSDPKKRETYHKWGVGGPDMLVRVVDVVCLLLMDKTKDGRVLVMTHETLDKTVHELLMVPGAKRRPDENQFLTAQRVLQRQLKLDETCVDLDASNVMILEDEKESNSYPGIMTLHRKRVIHAHFTYPD